jgi:hypothetical protein
VFNKGGVMKKNRKQQQSHPDTSTPQAVPQACPKTPVNIVAPLPEERIRQRAHEISMARGGAPGREMDDWLQAEREITAEMNQVSKAKG